MIRHASPESDDPVASRQESSAVVLEMHSLLARMVGKQEQGCRCLGVSEETLEQTIEDHDLNNLHEVMRCTGAGLGCTACHPRIRAYLARRNSRGS